MAKKLELPKCFKCEKEMTAAFRSRGKRKAIEDTWSMPGGGVSFDGGSNFGSAIYDSMIDGKYVNLIICDDCLVKHKGLIKESVDEGRLFKNVK